jgi:hypothetical protein
LITTENSIVQETESKNFRKLVSSLEVLKQKWSGVVSDAYAGVDDFQEIENQVKATIRECGYEAPDEWDNDYETTFGGSDMDFISMFCRPDVIVIIAFSYRKYKNEPEYMERRLKDIRAVSFQ